MARRRNRKDQRDNSDIPNERRPLLIERLTFEAPFRLPLSPLPHPDVPFDRRHGDALIDVEDRREFDPDPDVFMDVDASPAVIAHTHPPVSSLLIQPRIDAIPRHVQQFVNPERVAVCVRRQQRKEIMHVIRHAGRGGSKRRRRNEASNVRC